MHSRGKGRALIKETNISSLSCWQLKVRKLEGTQRPQSYTLGQREHLLRGHLGMQ